MMIVQYDLEDIDIAHAVTELLQDKIDEKFLFIPKNLWVLQDVKPEYLIEIRDKINKILESGEDNE